MKPTVAIKEIRTFVIKLSDDYDKVILSEDDAIALHAALEHAIYPYGVFGGESIYTIKNNHRFRVCSS